LQKAASGSGTSLEEEFTATGTSTGIRWQWRTAAKGDQLRKASGTTNELNAMLRRATPNQKEFHSSITTLFVGRKSKALLVVLGQLSKRQLLTTTSRQQQNNIRTQNSLMLWMTRFMHHRAF
jgi:hypothetical protein